MSSQEGPTGAQSIDDDILSDVRNLFISSSSGDEDYNAAADKFEIERDSEPETRISPEVPFDEENEQLENLKKSAEKPKEPEVEVKEEEVKTNPPTKPKPGQVITSTTDKKETKTQTPAKTTKETPKSSGKCKGNSDCDSSSFCQTKSGKCVAKIAMGQSGCASSDQCSGKIAACFNKKCLQSCNSNGEKSSCPSENQNCKIISDLKIFKGLNGTFNGVCEQAKATRTKGTVDANTSNSTGTGKSSMLITGAIVILAIAAMMAGFVYLRKYLRRRNRDNNPDMFLFNKLQRNASQALLQQQQPQQSPHDILNSRLSTVNGARFTKWAAL
jgi:hypothetical protein